MKIVFVLSLSLAKPGPSVHILTSLIGALADAGHIVHVIEQCAQGAQAPGLPPALRASGRVTCDAIPVPAWQKGNFVRRYLGQARYAMATGKYLRAHRDADLVYVHSCNTLAVFAFLARHILKRSALVVNVQDVFPENAALIGALNRGGALYRIMAALQRYAYRLADALVTLSEDMKETLVKLGAAEPNVHVIPLWTYTDDLAATPEADNRFLAAHPELNGFFRAVYAGNVGTVQNVDLVLKAAQLLQGEAGIRLIIVGDGAKKCQLEEDAQRMALDNLHFYGMQPSELAMDVYSMADVNLISLAKGIVATAFPSKTAPCMAVGRPICASVGKDSRYASMISGIEGCYVTEPDDAQGLSDAILRARDEGPGRVLSGARALYQTLLSQREGVKKHVDLFENIRKVEAR